MVHWLNCSNAAQKVQMQVARVQDKEESLVVFVCFILVFVWCVLMTLSLKSARRWIQKDKM